MSKNETFSVKKKKGDCECAEVIQLIVDGEANSDQVDFFTNHTEECLSCLEGYQFDAEFKKIIREKVAEMNIPKGLEQSIREKLSLNT